MKRRLAALLAAVTATAALAWGQSVRPGSVLVTEDVSPPPSVVRVNAKTVNQPTPQLPPNLPAPSKPVQPPPPVPQSTPTPPQGNNPASPGFPVPPRVAPRDDDRPIVTRPIEPPLPPVVHDEHGAYPGYATRFFEPVCPWTKCGRRYCGTVYVDTPYVWFDMEFKWNWIKKDQTVPLITRGGFNAANPGALNDPQTQVLFNGQDLHEQPYYGGQFMLGGWFDECQYIGGEIGYFMLARRDRGFIASANGNPGTDGLFIPFFNVNTGAEDAFAVATAPLPTGEGQASGLVQITSRSRVHGAETHFLFSFARGLSFRTDAIAGIRWLGLDEDIIVEETIRSLVPGTPIPVTTGITDGFSVRNDFVGFDVGLKTHVVHNCWSLDLLTRIALGGTHQQQRNNAWVRQVFTPTGDFIGLDATPSQTGRLITSTNSGEFSNDFFSVVPEVGVSIGWQPRNWCRFSLGYSWTYWTSVLRVGQTIDRVINPVGVSTRPEFDPTAIIEPRRPGIIFNESSMWIQSVNLGVQLLF